MSAKDLLRYYVSVDGKAPREILSKTHHTDMLTVDPPTIDGLPNYAKSWVFGGLGWCGYGATTLQGHNGGLAGGWGEMYGLDNGFSFAVLGNQDTGTGKCTPAYMGATPPHCGLDGEYSCATDATAILLDLLGKVSWTDQDLFGG
jgi:hypothetical protein